MNALIVADGDVPTADAMAGLLERQGGSMPGGALPAEWLVIAADGGALQAEALGLRPHVVVSDGDSLAESDLRRLGDGGAEVVRHVPEKDHSDTELAVREALRRGATRLRLIGALGGTRLEHALANVLLLALPALRDTDTALVDAATTVRVVDASRALAVRGEPGDYVSLLPLSDPVDGVTTTGLAYPLRDESLHQGATRGLSNEITDGEATVSVRGGRLLVVHTRRTAEMDR